MTWAIVSGADAKFRPITRLTFPTHAEYAARWGFSYYGHLYSHPEVPPSWLKLGAIKDAFYRGHEGVWWIDADAAITPLGIDELPPLPVATSVRLGYQRFAYIWPSCGLMAIRNDNVGNEWVDELARRKWQYLHHPWWEQAAAYELLGYDNDNLHPNVENNPHLRATAWTNRVDWFPEIWHGTPQIPSPGRPYLFHATGGPVPVSTRVEQLTEVLSTR